MSDAAVVFSNVSFAWPDDTPVFHDLSFSIPPVVRAWSRPTAQARAPCSS